MPRRAALAVLALCGAAHAAAPSPGVPRYAAALSGVTGSLDERTLPVTRSNVEALVHYFAEPGVFREVLGPERAGEPGLARLELEERYATNASGRRVTLSGTATLRVELPDGGPPLVLASEGRAERAAWSVTQVQQELLAEVQQQALDALIAALRAEPRLFQRPL